MKISLLYVSQSNLRLPAEEGAVDAIVATALARNPPLDVTGALVFTETRFAQLLEGPAEAVHLLMESIRADVRHRDVRVMLERPIEHRRFPIWAMAYAGPSTFVASHVLSLSEAVAPEQQLKAAYRLIDLMRQFVEAQLMEQRRLAAQPE